MQKCMVGFRVLLESILLWIGGCVAFFYLLSAAASASWLQPVLSATDNVFPIVMGVLLAAAILWIIIARKKEMGDRLPTGAYILLNLPALVPAALLAFAFMHSFD